MLKRFDLEQQSCFVKGARLLCGDENEAAVKDKLMQITRQIL